MTRATLEERVRQRLWVSGESAYPAAQIVAALNEGLAIFSLLTLSVERDVVVPLAPDTPVFRLRETVPDFLVPLRVRCRVRVPTAGDGVLWDTSLWGAGIAGAGPPYTETVNKLRPMRLRELAGLRPNWRLSRGPVQRYGVQGVDVAFAWPCPGPSDDVALLLRYAAEAAPLALPDQVPETPEEYHPALVSYAVATLPMAHGGSELAREAGEWQTFLRAARGCGAWVRRRAQSRGYDTMPWPIKLPEPKSKRAKA